MVNAPAAVLQVAERVPIIWSIEILDIVFVTAIAALGLFSYSCCRRARELEDKVEYLEGKLGELYGWAIAFYTDYKARMKVCCKADQDPTFPPAQDPKWP